MSLSRRILLAGLGSLPTLSRAGAEEPGLRELAAAAGLRFGSDSDVAIGSAPPAYSAAFARHCGLYAANLGWRRVAAGWEDPNIAFARRNGMALTGAHLLWHEALPPGFAQDGPAAARAAAFGHAGRLPARYAGQAFSWNVVNEAIDTRDGVLRQDALLKMLGPDYVAQAFHAAREADGTCLLAYNETNLEMATPFHAARRAALLTLLDDLVRAGAPIGAVGLQTHLRLDGARFDPRLYRRFLDEIASRGLAILITEMDVSDIGLAGGVAERDAAVAGRYHEVLSVALDEPAVKSVVLWGLSDRYTWLCPETSPRYRRADGTPARPLPLDACFRQKPAYAAIAAALANAPRRVAA